jgi:hypothetical protein
MVEPRRTPGSIVQSKAKFVMSAAECSRRYGAQSDTRTLNGQVISVRADRHPVSNRNKTMVEVNFFLGGVTYKTVVLFVLHILNGPFAEGRYDGFNMLSPNWVPDPVPNPPLLLQQQEQQPEHAHKHIKPNNNQPQYQTK